MEYGLLIYDIPQNRGKLYRRIRKAIRGKCLRVNLSVYLIQWAQKTEMDELIAAEGATRYCSLVKFDGSETERLEEIGRKCLREQAGRILRDLQKDIRETEVKSDRVCNARRKLAEVQAIALTFGFQPEIKHIVEASTKLIRLLSEKRTAQIRSRKVENKDQVNLDFKVKGKVRTAISRLLGTVPAQKTL